MWNKELVHLQNTMQISNTIAKQQVKVSAHGPESWWTVIIDTIAGLIWVYKQNPSQIVEDLRHKICFSSWKLSFSIVMYWEYWFSQWCGNERQAYALYSEHYLGSCTKVQPFHHPAIHNTEIRKMIATSQIWYNLHNSGWLLRCSEINSESMRLIIQAICVGWDFRSFPWNAWCTLANCCTAGCFLKDV